MTKERQLAAANDAGPALASSGWCILRTSSARTLPLAKSLARAGFDAWTPQEVRTKRKGRARVEVDFDVAILPSFVFVRADRLLDLISILALPFSQHPSFAIFNHDGRVPVIADGALAGIRAEEDRARFVIAERNRRAADRARRGRFRTVQPGQRVHVEDGNFAGLVGVVQQATERTAVVSFGDGLSFTIGTWLLLPDGVEAASLSESTAARAA